MFAKKGVDNLLKKIYLLLALVLALAFPAGCAVSSIDTGIEPEIAEGRLEEVQEQEPVDDDGISEGGAYTDRDSVAAYIHKYGKLPSNFITKKEAERLGWEPKEGNLKEVAPGMSIGGSGFGNYEGKLPEAEGRSWKECDINADGGYRGAERIIYSSDGLIYYTGDHYETFEQLY